jgi:hypothetical protein
MCHRARSQRDRPSEVAEGLHTVSVDSSLAQVAQVDRTGLPTAGRAAARFIKETAEHQAFQGRSSTRRASLSTQTA